LNKIHMFWTYGAPCLNRVNCEISTYFTCWSGTWVFLSHGHLFFVYFLQVDLSSSSLPVLQETIAFISPFFFSHAPYFGIISTTFPMARACLPCLPLSLLLRLTPSYGASIPIQHHRHAPFISLPTFLAHRSRRLTLIQCFSIVPSHSVRLLFLLSQTIDYHTYLTWRCIAITSIHPGPLDLESAYNHARRFGWQIPEW